MLLRRGACWDSTPGKRKHYFGFSRRWRDIPKPSIAAVQGACIAGGLLLAWPCDLIIAADNARFSDPVVLMGIGGVEYHGHTWELGPRKAKEMLFTAKPVSALEAERRGMVNRVVPVAELDQQARELALDIATKHPHALAMAKRAVNQTLDTMGQYAALQSCFDIHQLGHASAYVQSGQVCADRPSRHQGCGQEVMLRIDDADGIRTLTLNRPERLNTLTSALTRELHAALVDCARDPGVRCVILTGAGRGFCAGFDLSGGGEQPDPVAQRWSDEPIWWEPEQVAARLLEDMQIPILLHRMPKPTIASIRGPAAGTGLVLAAACDLRIASDTAVFKTAFASAGRCGDPGGSYLLTQTGRPGPCARVVPA